VSRYQVDKTMRQVVLDQQVAAAFRAGPDAFLDGRDLTDEERAALIQLDHRTLYRLGAHPFLLLGFMMATSTGDRAELAAGYSGSVAALGYPDFET